MTPLDLVSAAAWDRTLFTTYALSLSFFEAVILDRLMRGGSRQATILTDPDGLRAGLSEHGARRAGRDYILEPVACTSGVFHPKLSAFLKADDAHLLVGSGNLTFGGWGGNLEAIDHLHPSFAADAFEDAADFLELMTIADALVFDAADSCTDIAAALRARALGYQRPGRIRLVHSLGDPIATQLRHFADDLGGAERITTVSPFYDLDGCGIDALAAELRCETVQLHVHPAGVVRGPGSIGWPFESARRHAPVALAEDFPGDGRLLHAKCFEIRCKRGTILMSGSANATFAGLYGRNIEASVVRLLPRAKAYWAATPAEAPLRSTFEGDEDDVEAEAHVGILRAALDGDQLRGRVLTPRISGSASAALDIGGALQGLGLIEISADGRFQLPAPGLEAASFEQGRLVLRIEQGSRAIEGIVSITAAAALIRRVGAMAPHIMAMLAGSETPADVAAILSWFREDPSRLPTDGVLAGSGADAADGGAAAPNYVTFDALAATAGHLRVPAEDAGPGQPAWRNAMAMLRAAFRRSCGPWAGGAETDDDDDEDESAKEARARDQERHSRKTMRAFEDLLPIMLAPERAGRDATMALALAHFLADRLRPPPVKVQLWLGQILLQLVDFVGDDAPLAIAAVLVQHAASRRAGGAGRARRFFLERGLAAASILFEAEAAPAFADLLVPHIGLADFAAEVAAVRTPAEQIIAYVAAARGTGPREGYSLLARSPHWSLLARGLDNPSVFGNFLLRAQPVRVCPKCSLQLSMAKFEDLRETGVTRCCSLILQGTL